MIDEPDELLTPKQVAEELGITVGYVSELIQRDKLLASTAPGSRLLPVTRADLEASVAGLYDRTRREAPLHLNPPDTVSSPSWEKVVTRVRH